LVLSTFARELAARLKAAKETLVKRWLELIALVSPLHKQDVFPGHDLVDHVPLLIEGIADYVADPSLEISADAPVMAKAIELGRLRYEQGFDALQILKEYEILGNVLFDFLVEQAEPLEVSAKRAEVLICGHRVFHSIAVIQQHTTEGFLSLDENRVAEREQRLRSFNRMVSHELKNRMGAAWAAAELLRDGQVPHDHERYLNLIIRNLASVQDIINDLIQLSHSTESGDSNARRALLADLAIRIKDELHDFADRRHVRIEIDDSLPTVEVPAVAAELALRNLISNGAKYRDESKDDRWVRIDAVMREDDDTCRVEVRVHDNGIGVPEEDRARLFERFFRAGAARSTERGSGLGLSIVRETLETQGGKVWAEFHEEGTTFIFELPCSVRHELVSSAGDD
jgi:signal transduction histidine kinase